MNSLLFKTFLSTEFLRCVNTTIEARVNSSIFKHVASLHSQCEIVGSKIKIYRTYPKISSYENGTYVAITGNGIFYYGNNDKVPEILGSLLNKNFHRFGKEQMFRAVSDNFETSITDNFQRIANEATQTLKEIRSGADAYAIHGQSITSQANITLNEVKSTMQNVDAQVQKIGDTISNGLIKKEKKRDGTIAEINLLEETFNKIIKTTEALGETTHEVDETMQAFRREMSETCHAARRLANNAAVVVNSTISANIGQSAIFALNSFALMSEGFQYVAMVVAFFVILLGILRFSKFIYMVVAPFLGVPVEYLYAFCDALYVPIVEYEEEENESGHAQGKEQMLFYKEGATESFIAILSSIFKKEDSKDVMENSWRSKRIKIYYDMFKMSKDITGYIGWMIQFGFSWLYEKYYGYPYCPPDQEEYMKGIVEIIDKVNVLKARSWELSRKDVNYRENIKFCYHKSKSLRKEAVQYKWYTQQQFFFSKVCDDIDQLYAMVQTYEQTNVMRVEPVVFEISGRAGTGKSTVIEEIIRQLYMLCYNDKSPSRKIIYHRKIENEYWEGYTDNFAVLYDDYFQSTDLEQRRRICQEIISINNNAAYPLNMAFGEKGNAYFKSLVVGLTQNDPQGNIPTQVGIQENEAFERRRDFVYVITSKKRDNSVKLNWSDMRFDLVSKKGNARLQKNLTVQDIRNMLYSEMIVKKDKYEQLVKNTENNDNLNDDLENARKKYGKYQMKKSQRTDFKKKQSGTKFGKQKKKHVMEKSMPENIVSSSNISSPSSITEPMEFIATTKWVRDAKRDKLRIFKRVIDNVEYGVAWNDYEKTFLQSGDATKFIDSYKRALTIQANEMKADYEDILQAFNSAMDHAARMHLKKEGLVSVWYENWTFIIEEKYLDITNPDFEFQKELADYWYKFVEHQFKHCLYLSEEGALDLDANDEAIGIFDEFGEAFVAWFENFLVGHFGIQSGSEPHSGKDEEEESEEEEEIPPEIKVWKKKEEVLVTSPVPEKKEDPVLVERLVEKESTEFDTAEENKTEQPDMTFPEAFKSLDETAKIFKTSRSRDFDFVDRYGKQVLDFIDNLTLTVPECIKLQWIRFQDCIDVTGQLGSITVASRFQFLGKAEAEITLEVAKIYAAVTRALIKSENTEENNKIIKEINQWIKDRLPNNYDQYNKLVNDSTLTSLLKDGIGKSIEWSCKKFYEFLENSKPYRKSIAIILGILEIVFLAIFLYRKDNPKEQTGSDVNKGGRKAVARNRSEWGKVKYAERSQKRFNTTGSVWKQPPAKQQSRAFDKNAADLVPVVQKNMCLLTSEIGSVLGTFICDRTILTVRHFLRNIDYQKFTISWRGATFPIDPQRNINVIENADEDWCVIHIHPSYPIPSATDLRKFFIRHEDAYKVLLGGAIAVLPRSSENIFSVKDAGIVDISGTDHQGNPIENTYTTMFMLERFNKDGDCGLQYLVNNTAMAKKMGLMHSAGNETDISYAFLITAEDLEDAGVPMDIPEKPVLPKDIVQPVKQANQSVIVQQMFKSPVDKEMKVPPVVDLSALSGSNNEILGTVSQEWAIHIPNATDTVPTIFKESGMFKELKRPIEFLSKKNPDGKKIYPLTESARKKYPREANNYKHPDIDTILFLINASTPVYHEARELDDWEVLNGSYTSPFLKSLEMSTARGYDKGILNSNLFTQEFKDKLKASSGKKGVLKYLPEINEIVFDKHFYEEIYEPLKKNFPYQDTPGYPCICVDHIKDERLPEEKVFIYDVNNKKQWTMKYRLMCSVPLGYLLLEKKYMGAFYANTVEWRKHGGFCDIGNNPFSLDWEQMYKKIMIFGNRTRFIAGDFKSCDASIPKFLFDSISVLIATWYKANGQPREQHTDAIYVINALFGSKAQHIIGNTVFKACGLVSGRLMTTMTNSYAVLILMMLCAYEKCGEAGAIYVLNNLRSLGDDHVLPVDGDNPIFDMIEFNQFCARFGMVYTSIFKDKPLEKFYSINEMYYLKRKFVFSEELGCHVGLRDKEDIEDSLLYCTKSLNEERAARAVATSALYEAFLHGRAYFEELSMKINKVMHAYKYSGVVLTYTSIMRKFYRYADNTVFEQDKDAMMPKICNLEIDTNDFDLEEDMSNIVHTGKEQMDRSDRLPADAHVSTKQETVEFKDLVDFTDEGEFVNGESGVYKGTNPYPSFGLEPILTRQYLVGQVNWVTTTAIGSTLFSYYFPTALMVPNIVDKLDNFTYFRADVDVQIRLNTTQFNSGKLLVAYLPCNSNDISGTQLTSWSTNAYTASCCPHVLISANTQQAVSFRIPFLNLYDWWDMSDYASDSTMIHGTFGVVVAYVVAPLYDGSTTGTTTVPVSVFANFTNIQVTGPNVTSVTRRRGKEQMITNNTGPSTGIDPGLKVTPKLGIQSEDAKSEFKKRETQYVEQAIMSGNGGIVSDIMGAVARTGFRLSAVPIVGGIASALGTGAFMIAKKAAMIGLSQPTSTKDDRVIHISTGQQFSQVSGLYNGEKIALDPANSVSNDWRMWRMPANFMKFRYYKALPGLIYMTGGVASWAAGTVPLIIPVCPTYCYYSTVTGTPTKYIYYPTPLGNLSTLFAYWRGGIKYSIHIVCNTFTSFRMVVYWDPDHNDTGVKTDTDFADTFTRVIDVNGDTDIMITIPFINTRKYCSVPSYAASIIGSDTSSFGYNGCLKFQLLTNIYSSQVNPPIVSMLVYISGAEDFEVAVPYPISNTYSDAKGNLLTRRRAHEQMDPRATHQSSFEPISKATCVIQDKVVMGEDIDDFSALGRRFSYYTNLPFSSTVVSNTFAIDSMFQGISAFQRIVRSFLFFRGSIRLKFLVGDGYLPGVLFQVYFTVPRLPGDTVGLNYDIFNGLVILDFSKKQIWDVEIPFYSYLNWYTTDDRPTQFGAISPVVNVVAKNTPTQNIDINVFVAFGDDFSMGMPLNPVPLISTTAPFALNNNNKVKKKNKKQKEESD